MPSEITIDSSVCNGKPVFAGTRITVQTVLEFLAAGDSAEDILEQYPSLTQVHIDAALRYASKLAGNHFLVESVA